MPEIADLFPKLAVPRGEPQTPQEIERAGTYAGMRRRIVEAKSMKPAEQAESRANPRSGQCGGTGNVLLLDTWIVCVCVHGR